MTDPLALKDWMKPIPAEDLDTYRRGGFMQPQPLGSRPALIVVDVTLGFTGSRGLTLEQAIAEFPAACGPVAWEAVARMARLIEMCRLRALPIVFTRIDLAANLFAGNATKASRTGKRDPRFNDFPAEIAPREGEWVLEKTKASAFFQTPLGAYLVKERIDTVIVCGISTSGCVRATAVDAFSNGFTTFVVDDCCADRSWFAHCANLFDLNAKYASVVSLGELEAMLGAQRLSSAA
jgi:nicotinamidase-related amidase